MSNGAAAWLNLILACAPQVHPTTIQGIMQTESGGKPWVIGINRGAGRLARQPSSQAEAAAWASWLYDRGVNFDAGLMQINSVNWKRLGLTPQTVFDPCTNVRAGAKILTDNYLDAQRRHGPGQRALLEAFSMYNTGKRTAGFSNGYVGKVSGNAARYAGVAPPFIAGPSAPRPASRTASQSAPQQRSSGVAPPSAWAASNTWGIASAAPAPTPTTTAKKEIAE